MLFDKILIANRGEIACRVALTCQRLGIRTVAVYSDADADAKHVSYCDEAYRLGPAPARDSYLRSDLILDIARRSNAQAIHPGYGFLSENADFSEACSEAGIVFIGPPAAAIRAMGSKSAAKTIMEKAQIPLVPGYHGAEQDADTLTAAAENIGYPVLIKASSGGGGKGMRIVESAGQLDAAIASAKREASSAFADDTLLIEKYLLQPRHIEFQVFADQHGNVVHLFERDCSIQRRHQKILEEAPAPGMTESLRQQMGEAAVSAARAIGYVGAGTIEFIVAASGEFYFMEMNTRLQVEHPVTEMISGQDLVEWQLRVAAGETLPCSQEQLNIHGHAFEARVYAENPARQFMPSTGQLVHLRTPAENQTVRIDSGVREGDAISMYYDPMIAKLIVWGENRDSALRRLRYALSDYQIVGVHSNLDFLAKLAAHPAFNAAEINTGFIEQHSDTLFPAARPLPDRILAIAALAELLRIRHDAEQRARQSSDPTSPWHQVDGWRMNDDNFQRLYFRYNEEHYELIAHYRSGHYLLELPGKELPISGEISDAGELTATIDDTQSTATLLRQQETLTIFSQGERYELQIHNSLLVSADDHAGDDHLSAPMPGTITKVMVEAGASVKRGEVLMLLEAMKMEHSIVAPQDGRIEQIHFAVGDQVQEGVELLTLASDG